MLFSFDDILLSDLHSSKTRFSPDLSIMVVKLRVYAAKIDVQIFDQMLGERHYFVLYGQSTPMGQPESNGRSCTYDSSKYQMLNKSSLLASRGS